MLEDIEPLPGAERQPAAVQRNADGRLRQRRADVRRHVVGPFGRCGDKFMPIVRQTGAKKSCRSSSTSGSAFSWISSEAEVWRMKQVRRPSRYVPCCERSLHVVRDFGKARAAWVRTWSVCNACFIGFLAQIDIERALAAMPAMGFLRTGDEGGETGLFEPARHRGFKTPRGLRASARSNGASGAGFAPLPVTTSTSFAPRDWARLRNSSSAPWAALSVKPCRSSRASGSSCAAAQLLRVFPSRPPLGAADFVAFGTGFRPD